MIKSYELFFDGTFLVSGILIYIILNTETILSLK